jgi:hypothetical protein
VPHGVSLAWTPVESLIVAIHVLFVAQAEHLASDDRRARTSVRCALRRLRAIEKARLEPDDGFTLRLVDAERSAKSDLTGVWTVF